MLYLNALPPPVARLLRRLAPLPALSEFSLAGGTSLALRFGHRVSVDLDFFTTLAFDPARLLLESAVAQSRILGQSAGSLNLEVEGVKVDFLRHDYPLLEEPEVFDGVRMLSIRDVAAMKLNAIVNRGAKKDFYDLHTLLCHHSLPELMEAYARKYPQAETFMLMRSLSYFEDAESEPDPVSLTGQTWSKVKAEIARNVRELGIRGTE